MFYRREEKVVKEEGVLALESSLEEVVDEEIMLKIKNEDSKNS